MDQSQLKYAKTHEWVLVEGDQATIGITDFAVHLLSDLVYVDLPAVGKALKAGEPCGEIESVKAVSDIYAPVSGTVTEVNTALPNSLEVLNSDPFGAGWMIKAKITDTAALGDLLDQKTYKAHCETEGH